ncbi:hypothetical protein LEP1GSC188_1485 [Leptospira weilii serovar Topaz str. LT2116]|uniref:Uncharacterized protein n=1 Tax=Leptospira weilii serovar Topaz str. LT2116 TaxID=1088540 RepID=M3FGX3_9LEPT|nr:hypothetical protein LEP1GSC188_1485 [Leptospira weilii serovar Topaz str. LT2116]
MLFVEFKNENRLDKIPVQITIDGLLAGLNSLNRKNFYDFLIAKF